MHSRLNILFIEDNPDDFQWVVDQLEHLLPRGYVLDHVTSLAEAASAIDEQNFDVVLTELTLPDSDDLNTYHALKQRSAALPIVILTRVDNDELAMTAVRQGAQDYLVKQRTDGNALVRALRYAVERQHLHEKLRTLTLEDELTGLYNQRGFYALAHEYAALAKRSNRGMLILFIDLDGLKKINDVHGHSEGSRSIIAASVVLEKTFRDTDLLARWGGDEFVVLLMETDDQTPDLIRERLDAILTRHNTQMRRGYDLAMSIGVARFDPRNPQPIEVLLKAADDDMYAEKRRRHAAREE